MGFGDLGKLRTLVRKAYEESSAFLPFHNLSHVKFVVTNALIFNDEVKADKAEVEVAAWVHDLNYLIERNSDPEAGTRLRRKIITDSGFTRQFAAKIETIVLECHTSYRNKEISNPGKCVSDADTLFKSLPITPMLFAVKYLDQCEMNIGKLASKIVKEQKPLMDKGIYFYTEVANTKYQKWARTNLNLWENVLELVDHHKYLIGEIAGMEQNKYTAEELI